MVLRDLLSQNKTSIVEGWFESILKTYPSETAKFLRKEKDRFANPVRHTILRGIEGMYAQLLQDEPSPETLNAFLDNVIRIRSVQDFSPSQALAFVFSLKAIVREVLREEIDAEDLYEEVLVFESRIDNLALRAFDVYMECREKIYELRVNEVKAQREMAIRILERTNRASEKRGRAEEELPEGH